MKEEQDVQEKKTNSIREAKGMNFFFLKKEKTHSRTPFPLVNTLLAKFQTASHISLPSAASLTLFPLIFGAISLNTTSARPPGRRDERCETVEGCRKSS